MKLKSAASKRTFYILIPFVLPLCMIAMGILLMVNEDFFNKVFMILGSILAFVGLIKIILYAAQKTTTASQKPLFSGIAFLMVGVLLIVLPFAVNTLIPVLIGLAILSSGISGVANTMAFRREGENLIVPLLFAITNCILGIFVLIYVLVINSYSGWNILGILMIISGVLRIFNEIAARLCGKSNPNIHASAPIETSAEPIPESEENE